MTKNAGQRVKAVPSLSKILAQGTEGGKEFGRVVGLLLFNDSKRRGEEFNLFDDASGDFEGLDGFSRRNQSGVTIGYQYKFFSSPLSNDHRQEIIKSLTNALERNETLKLVKWVLVTPDDFKNSARRDGGGDVDWFEKLKSKYSDKLEIDHIGHSKLQDLFLQTHHLCLYYYPEQIVSGKDRRRTLQELRSLYDKNMRQRYGRIEFVGMSVYKEEASRRIPLEDIYIPLSLVRERAEEETDITPRIDSIKLLEPGAKSVVLGDPGSGKSTLFAFLALVGISERLQTRCESLADRRLTIVITLRRYADELKSNKDLSILEYVRKVAEADFNLSGLTSDFYEYYLESGQAIILFDGLDELPGYHFKDVVRRRVESFTASFPGNTIVISSRIVGYEAEARFDDSYSHYRIAKLKIREIEKFISDWYAVRVEDLQERDRNANDLIKVIVSPESDSIRALARNPLLLTIVALVHRIDAVLPDQRVVLYQKCTETLLNTWYKSKRNDEEIIKGRVEQRNRVRVESIAYWMHTKSIGIEGRSVAEHQELLTFLTNHIKNNESLRESDDHPEDQAEAFLSFIKNSAGLLVEAGDGLYSFIHLTFQEYLCATYLLAFGETRGAQSIWDELQGALQTPRWREVVRLLVASLKSSSGKSFFIDKLLDESGPESKRDTALLLTGLLRDSIEAAELRAEDIFVLTIQALALSESSEDFAGLKQSIETLAQKDPSNAPQIKSAFEKLYHDPNYPNKLRLILTNSALGNFAFEDEDVAGCTALLPGSKSILNSLILSQPCSSIDKNSIRALQSIYEEWTVKNVAANAAATVGLGIVMLLDPLKKADKLFYRELSLLFSSNFGPHHDHGLHLVALAGPSEAMHPAILTSLKNSLRGVKHTTKREVRSFLSPAIKNWIKENLIRPASLPKFFAALDANKPIKHSGFSDGDLRDITRRGKNDFYPLKIRNDLLKLTGSQNDFFWETIRNSNIFSSYLIPSFQIAFEEEFDFHWGEALKNSLKLSLPTCLKHYFNLGEWHALVSRLQKNSFSEQDVSFASWIVLFDIWVYLRNGYSDESESPASSLISASSTINDPKLKLAIVLRNCFVGERSGIAEFSKLLAGDEQVMAILSVIGWPSSEEIFTATPKRQSISKANHEDDDLVTL